MTGCIILRLQIYSWDYLLNGLRENSSVCSYNSVAQYKLVLINAKNWFGLTHKGNQILVLIKAEFVLYYVKYVDC